MFSNKISTVFNSKLNQNVTLHVDDSVMYWPNIPTFYLQLSNTEVADLERFCYEVIETNALVKEAKSYNVSSLKEYKIKKSTHIIDKIGDLICPLYGLSKEQTDFINNYEIRYQVNDE